MKGKQIKHHSFFTAPSPLPNFRLAAVGVATRVAEEMAVPLGSDVGYMVKGDSKASAQTSLLFCTYGVLLRRLQDDPDLVAFSPRTFLFSSPHLFCSLVPSSSYFLLVAPNYPNIQISNLMTNCIKYRSICSSDNFFVLFSGQSITSCLMRCTREGWTQTLH